MLYILAGILIIISVMLTWLLFGVKKKLEEKENNEKIIALSEGQKMLVEQNKMLMNQNESLRQVIDNKLSETHKTTQNQMSQSARQIADVVAGLTKIEEASKQMINVKDQIQNLQDILKNPKQRGILGEYFLETVLKNVLPPSTYKMQYSLGKDEENRELIVDAAIFFQDKIIPVDSKFSLENYNRILECKDQTEREKLEKSFKNDLKNRIDETAKYIQPKKDTMDFALMFIPSEAIFYDLLVNKVGDAGVNAAGLIEYAGRKKVNIVSPNSFYAFLQTILQGLKQIKIEKSTKEIIKRVQNLGNHIQKYETHMAKLGNNLATTVGSYENARKEFIKIDKDVLKIGGAERELIETVEVEKPREEE